MLYEFKIIIIRRNLMKHNRVIVSLLAIIMCVSLCACTGTSKAGSNTQTQVIYPETTDAKPVTIGYTFWDLDFDGFMNDQANQIKLVADALNVNLIFNPNTTDFSAESMVSAAEYFAEQNVDGMIVVNFSDESLIDISNICEENKIPFMQATRTIDNKDIAKIVENNPYYIGRMHESEYSAAYEVGRKLIDSGAKKIVMFSAEHGDVAYEARAEGFRDACEEPDVEIIEEVWDLFEDEVAAETISSTLKKYPEADGIFAVRGGLYPWIVMGEDNAGITDYIPIAGVDVDQKVGAYMESGAILAAAGGHHADASLTLITLVNAIRGSYDKSSYPIDINYNMMVIDSPESYKEYNYWCLGYDEDFDNRQIINANDARGLCVDFNPGTTLNDMIVFAENMSIEGVKERHKQFVKE